MISSSESVVDVDVDDDDDSDMEGVGDMDSLDDDGEIKEDETKCCGVLRIIIDVVDIVLVVIGVAVVLREKAATS